MIDITLAAIATAVDGRVDVPGDSDPNIVVSGPVVIDSREAEPGSLFVARAGEVQDGHDFVPGAMEAGAVAVLAERPVNAPAVIVNDSEKALGLLARSVVTTLTSKTGLRVVGVTGSSGKTTTKDLLAQVLAPLGPVVAPKGSLNTEVGVPLTVLTADETTRTLVVEMGARGIGHIEYLCGIAPPQIGVVLNVGSAHVGEFGDRESIAQAKGELAEAVPADGTVVLNADDPLVRSMAERTEARVLMVGESVHADVRADNVELDDQGRASFGLVTPGGSAKVSLSLVGEHHVANALAAAGTALASGMTVDEVATELTKASVQSRWRMEVTKRADGVTIVNDAYNANPESMRAALKALSHLGRGSRTWAILGEMLELGERADAEHTIVGQLAAGLDVSRILAIGEGARPISLGASDVQSWGGEATWVADADAALGEVEAKLQPGDVVLVKASRATGLERLAQALLAQEDADT